MNSPSLVYEQIISSESTEPIRMLFRVDAVNKLPQLCRIEGRRDDKGTMVQQRFSFPQIGPSDIYDLGVPKTTERIDRLPSADLKRIDAAGSRLPPASRSRSPAHGARSGYAPNGMPSGLHSAERPAHLGGESGQQRRNGNSGWLLLLVGP